MTTARRRPLRRGAYLVPSLFTMGNTLLGFYAVVRGLREEFAVAAIFLFAAGILDGLDGYVARLTGTETDFGREFDSLADVLTFGAAPALLAVLWFGGEFGRPGWLVPLFYLLACATRLARYNVQSGTVDSRWFVGLPTPAAAGAIGAVFLLSPYLAPDVVSVALMVALLALGVLMVSTFRYVSVKKLHLRQRWSYRAAIVAAAVLLLLAYRPRLSLIALASAYAVSGPGAWVWGRLRRRSIPSSGAEPTEESVDSPFEETRS